jgi:(R,R)-butanediol dehydrogenase/meso-butanediol dehydrogenase/diacetyl reductase
MKAVYYEGNRKFTLGDCVPVPPGPGEVRLEVAYCGVCGTDVHIAHGVMDQRIKAPQVIGHEMSGTIAELGAGVTGFAVGESVAVRPLDSRREEPSDKGVSHICRKLNFIGIDTPGAFQSSWTVPAFTLHKLPPGIDLKLAAFVEPLAVACHDIRLGEVKAGEFVVVIGGGPIGMLIGLAAQERGARVLLSEINDSRLALARELGFQAVHPARENLLEAVLAATGRAGADAVFEVSGSQPGASAMTELACLRGRVVVVGIFARSKPWHVHLFDILWKELKVIGTRVYEPQDYDASIALIASGKLPLARLITEVVPLARLPELFAALGNHPEGMKTLVDCRS